MREGWTETTLGDVVDIQKGKKPPVLDVFEPLSKPYLTADVLRGATCEQFVSDGLAATCVHLSGNETVLLWDGAGAGDVFKSQPGILASTMAKVQSKSNSAIGDGYLYLYLDSKRIEIKSSCRGTTVPHVSPEALKSMSFFLPPLAEQKRIVDVVTSVDTYIDALQKQADTARAARNAVLHELLSAGGDDWTETTLGELCELYQPETISKAQMDDAAPYIVYGANGPVGRYSRFNHEEPEVVVTCRGATCGVVNMTPPNCWITGNAMVVKPRDNRATKGFLFWALQTSVDVQATVSGSAQPQITRTGLEPSRILVPPFVEQKQIVEIVSSMNDVIQSTEQAVANAKNLRSGLLSDLLSGEHEIPASYDSLVGAA